MRKVVFSGLAVLAMGACSAREPSEEQPSEPQLLESNFDGGKPMWVGPVERSHLREEPFDRWFDSGYEAYTPDAAAVSELGEALSSVRLEVYLGTWCGDSRREVPRLYRVVDEASFPEDRIEVHALSDHDRAFKHTPGGKERERLVHRTPTIILMKNGEEMGRIVQNPRSRIETDLLAIAKGDSYTPRFGAESRLHEIVSSRDVDFLERHEEELAEELGALGETESLWHYAEYDLLVNDKPREAVAVLNIYLHLFPESSKAYYLLATAYRDLGEIARARDAVTESLRYDENDRKARALLKKLSAK